MQLASIEQYSMKLKIAILDLYDGFENQGMRCIREIINQWSEQHHIDIDFDEFDVRRTNQVPDTSYDAYISSGGPGSPLESEGSDWELAYYGWLQQILDYNANIEGYPKKKVFFICHSFQLACRYFNIGNVCKRVSTAFGVFPIHMTLDGQHEQVFKGLRDPFYGVDSRDFQVIEPDMARIESMGGQILAIEKERPHVPYERAIMAMRFNEHMIGTQFHPEADALGMSMHLQTEARKKIVVENHGLEKWQSMIDHLNDPDKILWTYSHILPNFLLDTVHQLAEAE